MTRLLIFKSVFRFTWQLRILQHVACRQAIHVRLAALLSHAAAAFVCQFCVRTQVIAYKVEMLAHLSVGTQRCVSQQKRTFLQRKQRSVALQLPISFQSHSVQASCCISCSRGALCCDLWLCTLGLMPQNA